MDKIITVEDLISKLQEFPKDIDVLVEQVGALAIWAVEERAVDIYRDGKYLGNKKAIVLR